MFSTNITCGYCSEYFANQHEFESHACEAAELFTERNIPTGRPFTYYYAEAEAFLLKYPEFRDQSSPYLSELLEAPSNYDAYDLPVDDYTGPGTTELTRELEWDGIYSLRDN